MTADAVRCDRCRREPAIRVLAGIGYCWQCCPGKKPSQPAPISVIAQTLPDHGWEQMDERERNRHLCRRSYMKAKLAGLCPKCRLARPEEGYICCAACRAAMILQAAERKRG